MQNRPFVAATFLLLTSAPFMAFAQECPQNESHLPPVIDETSAWCPTCAHGALEMIDASLGEAAALETGVDQTAQSILKIVRAEESGSVNPNYSEITTDSGGLTYGAYQFDSNSGELGALLKRYTAAAGNTALTRALAPYTKSLSHGGSPNNSTLRNLLRQAAKDPIMQQTQDEYYIDQHVKPSMQAAADLGIRSPFGAALYADIQTNGGIISIVAEAKRRVPVINTPGDETRFLQAMMDAHEARFRRLARHGMGKYLSGWLARNNDFRKVLAKNALGMEGKVTLPHIGVSFCAGNHADARAFGLYMASLAESRNGAAEVAIVP